MIRKRNPVINPEKCHFCGACLEVCPHNIFFYVPEENKVKIREVNCFPGCFRCARACPEKAITLSVRGNFTPCGLCKGCKKCLL